jgi:hypothetical protein
MADPPRLPPPPFWRTSYYATSVIGRPDRRDIDPADVRRAIATPYRRQRQPNGRWQHWIFVAGKGRWAASCH